MGPPPQPLLGIRRLWRPLLRTALSVVLLAWLFSRVDTGQLRSLLATTDLRFWAGGFACACAAWLINTRKWQQLLNVQGYPTAYGNLLALNYIGMFYGILLPGQVSGEVMKGLRLARMGTPAGTTAVSIIMDRLTGLVALGLLGLIGLLAAPPPFAAGPFIWLTAIIAIVAALPVAMLIARASSTPAQPEERLPRLQTFAHRASVALAAYRSAPTVLLLALAEALVFQALIVSSNYLVARGLGVDVPLLSLAWIVSVVSLVSMLPLTLGGLGLREGSYVLLLQQYAVDVSHGLSLSLAVFGIILLQGIIGGVLETLWPRLTSSVLAAPQTSTDNRP